MSAAIAPNHADLLDWDRSCTPGRPQSSPCRPQASRSQFRRSSMAVKLSAAAHHPCASVRESALCERAPRWPLRSRLLRWARCKAVLKSHAHPEMPFCRFRMTRMARPALNHQRARIALLAQRWPTSSLRSSATCWRRRRRRILPCRSCFVGGTLCQTPT